MSSPRKKHQVLIVVGLLIVVLAFLTYEAGLWPHQDANAPATTKAAATPSEKSNWDAVHTQTDTWRKANQLQ